MPINAMDTSRRGRPVAKKGWLSAKDRDRLPKGDFALPGRGEGPEGKGSGAYPIPDKAHARNALARVAQHGSSAEKAEVRRKVHSKFPTVGRAEKRYGKKD